MVIKYPFIFGILVCLTWSESDRGVWQDPNIPATVTSHFSGTCNSNKLYSRVGDRRQMCLNYACMTGTPTTRYRELLSSKP